MADQEPSERRFWQSPSLHGGDETRGVNWIDLFFDLFFVVVIAELAHHLTQHPDAAGVRTFVLLFIPVWWVWIGDTWYGERFETEGIETRLYLYALMLPIIGMAVYAGNGLGETYAGFALSYAVARGVITLMWGWATVTSPAFRPTERWYVGMFSLSAAQPLSVWSGASLGPARAARDHPLTGQAARLQHPPAAHALRALHHRRARRDGRGRGQRSRRGGGFRRGPLR